MSAKLEEIAHIKASIIEALRRVEQDDSKAAIHSLAEALSSMLDYMLQKENPPLGGKGS